MSAAEKGRELRRPVPSVSIANRGSREMILSPLPPITWAMQKRGELKLRPKSTRWYPRADRHKVIDKLHALANVLREMGWEECGGYLLRDEAGEVSGRTKWIPRAQWWAARPFPFSEDQCAGIVLKLLNGGKLTRRMTECVAHLLRIADNDGLDPDMRGPSTDFVFHDTPDPHTHTGRGDHEQAYGD
jgi:hypothetical protein